MSGMRSLPSTVCLVVAFVSAFVARISAQSTEESFVKLAGELPFVSYGDFLYDRIPRDHSESREVTKAWDALQAVMKTKPAFHELAALAEHTDPKVRTLALLGLFALEDPGAFPIICTHLDDKAETFPSHSAPLGNAPGEAYKLHTEPQSVRALAGLMQHMADFLPSWHEQDRRTIGFNVWISGRMENPVWIGWYEFLFKRATGGTNPPPEERADRYAALRKKMEGLPVAVRGWVWFALADDAMSIPRYDIALATEAEMVAAGRQIGPDALLAFLRDGSRAGLGDPKADNPAKGVRFILTHAKQLFDEKQAGALLEMGHFIAAADAKPSMASEWIRAALKAWSGSSRKFDRGTAVAALLDMRGDAETEFIVNWFYSDPDNPGQSGAQHAFTHEVERRRTREWKATVRRLVAHEGFERLLPFDVIYVASMVNKLSGEEVVGKDLLHERSGVAVRNMLRKYFGISQVTRKRLETPLRIAKDPIWSARIEDERVTSLVVSPDGMLVAVGRPLGNVLLFDAASGRPRGEIPVSANENPIQFRKSDGHLLTIGKTEVTEWDAGQGKMISQLKLDRSAYGNLGRIAVCENGLILGSTHSVSPTVGGLAVIDLTKGSPRWNQRLSDGSGVIALSPDGNRLAVGGRMSKVIDLRDAVSGKFVARLEGHANIPTRACFSPDGSALLTTADDSKVMLWDGRTGKLRCEFACETAHYNAIAFSADSKRFVVSSERGHFGVFDSEKGIAQDGYEFHGNWVSEMAVSRDGKLLFMVGHVCNKEAGSSCYNRLDCWKLPPAE